MKTLLVIDDERSNLNMFRLLLNAYGYKVLIAETGDSGLDLFGQEKPSIVITDIKMPVIDGLTVLKQIKQIRPETEVIVITGHGDTDLAQKAKDLGAVDFINKPVRREALDAALQKAESRLAKAK